MEILKKSVLTGTAVMALLASLVSAAQTPNTPPQANDDIVNAVAGQVTIIRTDDLLANDSDNENDPLSLILVDDWTGGSVVLRSAQGEIEYPPTPGGTIEFTPDGTGNGQFTYTLSDGNDAGNYELMAWGQVTVIVGSGSIDTVEPVISIDGYNDADTINLTVGDAFTVPAATAIDDVDGSVAISQNNTVDRFTAGTYAVNYSASDAAGNTATAMLTVVVAEGTPVDTIAPVITITGLVDGDTVNVVTGGSFTVPSATATDNIDGIVNVAVSSNVDTSTAGTYGVNYSATDTAGNTATAALLVEVADDSGINTPPIAFDDTVTGAVVGQPLVIRSDDLLANDTDAENDRLIMLFVDDWIGGTVVLKSAQGLVESFPTPGGTIEFTPDGTGDGQFTYTLSDGKDGGDYELMAWGGVTVVVGSEPGDTIAPVITIAGHISGDTINLTVGDAFIAPAATAIDAVDGSVAVSETNNVNTSLVGSYMVNYTASDTSGNTATAMLTVVVSDNTPGDTTPPVISIDGYTNGQSIVLNLNDGFIVPVATAMDDVDGTVAVTETNTVDTSVAGNYSVSYSAADVAGNMANASLFVVVRGDIGDLPNAVDSVRQFTFNHSLWDHNGATNAVTGYWVGDFASASNTTYAWSGQFGQLDYHELPPRPWLGSLNSEDLWSEDPYIDGDINRPNPLYRATFEEVELDNIIIMPNNFGRGGNEVSQTYLDDTYRVIDDIAVRQPDVPVIIYEHWPEAIADILNREQWDDYHVLQLGDYHQWFLNYQNIIAEQRPDIELLMIPVGPIISDIMTNSALQTSQMAWQELYDDNAPHGTPDLYFLAGLVTYQALFGQPVIDSYTVPSQIDLTIANEFSALNDYVWQRLNFYNDNGVRVWPDAVDILPSRIQVSNTAELNAAVNELSDGGIISLQAGVYTCFRLENRRYSEASPLLIEGVEGDNSLVVFEDDSSDGEPRACTSSLDIRSSSYVAIRDVSVQRGLFSLSISGSDHVIVDNVDVSLPLQSGIHVNKNSSDVDILNSRIFNTGQSNPQWGECIYVGTGGSQDFPDETVRVWIENNEVFNCGFGEGINIKPEVFDSTVRGNYVHNITPGSPLYTQFNQAAITVEGGRGSNPSNNHRPGDPRNIWVENNRVEQVLKSVFDDVGSGRRAFASGIMVGGTGVYVENNVINDYQEDGILVNGYGNLGLPVYLHGNQIGAPIVNPHDIAQQTNQVNRERDINNSVGVVQSQQESVNPNSPQNWLNP
ncbi:MAG: immunoglobulin-like domain-containing protein [Arenicella sp.]